MGSTFIESTPGARLSPLEACLMLVRSGLTRSELLLMAPWGMREDGDSQSRSHVLGGTWELGRRAEAPTQICLTPDSRALTIHSSLSSLIQQTLSEHLLGADALRRGIPGEWDRFSSQPRWNWLPVQGKGNKQTSQYTASGDAKTCKGRGVVRAFTCPCRTDKITYFSLGRILGHCLCAPQPDFKATWGLCSHFTESSDSAKGTQRPVEWGDVPPGPGFPGVVPDSIRADGCHRGPPLGDPLSRGGEGHTDAS